MLSTLFIFTTDWVMRNTASNISRGIGWYISSILQDLDFADDIALLFHSRLHIQSKTNRLYEYAGHIGLKKITNKKTEVITLNIDNPSPVIINEEIIKGKNSI
jgi:hypothetical protein